MEVFSAASDDVQSNIIVTKSLDICLQGIQDSGDPIIMQFI
jgi:hypothetical protein